MENALEVQAAGTWEETTTEIGMFDYLSLTTHACLDCCALRPFQGGVAIVALRPIARGEMLCWNYNLPDSFLTRSTEDRRDLLLERRGFYCR